jgi:hypothetical protein
MRITRRIVPYIMELSISLVFVFGAVPPPTNGQGGTPLIPEGCLLHTLCGGVLPEIRLNQLLGAFRLCIYPFVWVVFEGGYEWLGCPTPLTTPIYTPYACMGQRHSPPFAHVYLTFPTFLQHAK